MQRSKLKLENIPNKLLSLKYFQLKEEYDKMHINILIFAKKSHYLTEYKDFLIFNYIDEFLKRLYRRKESEQKLPKIAHYYKNYLRFFCRPCFKNFVFINMMQNFGDNKAEIFYKNNYCSEETKPSKKSNENNNSSTYSNIIFDANARKAIDENNLLTTITLNTIHSNRSEDNSDIFKEDDFFTIKTQNDCLLEMLQNLTKKTDKKSKKKILLTKKELSDSNKKLLGDTLKSPKSSLCNLYKKTKFSLNEKSNFVFSNYTPKSQVHSPKLPVKSNISQFRKFKPISKEKKNSFMKKSNVTDILKSKNCSFKNSLINCSVNNKSKKSQCNTGHKKIKKGKYSLDFSKKFSKSKSNRNKCSTSPKDNLIMTYLTNCLSNHNMSSNTHAVTNNLAKKEKKGKHIFSLRTTFMKKKNLPLNLHYVSKAPLKGRTTKNSTNNSRIMKSNQSLETLFKKKISKQEQHSNTLSTTKKEVNFNVNVNLNNININIHTNEQSSNPSFICRNKSHSNLLKRSFGKEKCLSPEMEKIINGIKSNINSGRMIHDLVHLHKNKSITNLDYMVSKPKSRPKSKKSTITTAHKKRSQKNIK